MGRKRNQPAENQLQGSQHLHQSKKKGAEKLRRLLWVFRTGSDVFSSPAIGGEGIVYFGSEDRKVYAIDAETGEKNGNLKLDLMWDPPLPLVRMALFMSVH